MIFVSGDPHWAEFMAKKMPESDQWGPSQILYEVKQNYLYDFYY